MFSRMVCSLVGAQRSQLSTYGRILIPVAIRRDEVSSIHLGAKEKPKGRSLNSNVHAWHLYSGANKCSTSPLT